MSRECLAAAENSTSFQASGGAGGMAWRPQVCPEARKEFTDCSTDSRSPGIPQVVPALCRTSSTGLTGGEGVPLAIAGLWGRKTLFPQPVSNPAITGTARKDKL